LLTNATSGVKLKITFSNGEWFKIPNQDSPDKGGSIMKLRFSSNGFSSGQRAGTRSCNTPYVPVANLGSNKLVSISNASWRKSLGK
jgi:hypothetical protein